MKHIHFIINPKAGRGKSQITYDFLRPFFNDENYFLKVKSSSYKKEAVLLTQESIKEGANIIVACGGDGTINEVASSLVGTDMKLGIIPLGSGNGLASNLNIPRNIEKAISIIKEEKQIKIDVGSINGRFFFSNTGIGFDANIIKNYEISGRHTLTGYIMASLKTFNEWHKKEKVDIFINQNHLEINPFMIFISNSNELGYNVSLTPEASLQDGLLDVIIIPQIGKFKMLWFGILLLLKKQHMFKEIRSFQSRDFHIYKSNEKFIESQIDGELCKMEGDSIYISLKEKSLSVLI
ncbi:MAG: diacylglycerol kinase family protein [Maribacter sp.]